MGRTYPNSGFVGYPVMLRPLPGMAARLFVMLETGALALSMMVVARSMIGLTRGMRPTGYLCKTHVFPYHCGAIPSPLANVPIPC